MEATSGPVSPMRYEGGGGGGGAVVVVGAAVVGGVVVVGAAVVVGAVVVDVTATGSVSSDVDDAGGTGDESAETSRLRTAKAAVTTMASPAPTTSATPAAPERGLAGRGIGVGRAIVCETFSLPGSVAASL